jgi:hypothetical protein
VADKLLVVDMVQVVAEVQVQVQVVAEVQE